MGAMGRNQTVQQGDSQAREYRLSLECFPPTPLPMVFSASFRAGESATSSMMSGYPTLCLSQESCFAFVGEQRGCI